jgi:Asp/Glu/hydantoin racemase
VVDDRIAVRIFYQSFLDPGQHASYFARLRAYLAEIADPDTEFEVGGIQPPDGALSRLSEFRCAIQVVDHALAASERGFDAVLIGHFQDAGLYEARSAVDIPVLGMGEASMLFAATLGRGFGLVTINDVFLSWHREQADRYGVGDRLIGVEAMATPVSELVAAFDDAEAYARVRAAFQRCAQPLADAHAEVIIPAGGLFGLLSASDRTLSVGDATVLNPISVSAKLAEISVKLGLRPSRASTFALAPPRAVEEFRAAARHDA